jgi:small subunit ribosomal protein S13
MIEQKTQTIKQKEVKKDYGLIRILSKDIEGKLPIYAGLTKIPGISWTLSHVICLSLNIPKIKRIGDLSQDELSKIINFIKNPKIPSYLLNKRKDFDDGKSMHLLGNDLDLSVEFDIKRMKKIKSYKGLRHAAKKPVRGQRTRSHFRAKKRKAVGVKLKK